jgi:hypothetical protein
MMARMQKGWPGLKRMARTENYGQDARGWPGQKMIARVQKDGQGGK